MNALQGSIHIGSSKDDRPASEGARREGEGGSMLVLLLVLDVLLQLLHLRRHRRENAQAWRG